jgi:2-methylcitrate dehydratase PrpD
VVKNLDRITAGLGNRWDSRNSSFKPFPSAHVLHPYIDLVLRLRARHGFRPADIVSIECPVAEFNVSIVCEPVAEKTAPATEAHCRVCLQYTLAEAMVRGELGRGAHADAFRTDPEILALARRVTYRVDPSFPPPGQFKGAVTMTLADGRVLSEVEEYNRGSAENPMTAAELRAKFDDNAGSVLDAAARERLAGAVAAVESMDDAEILTAMTVGRV